MYSKLLKDNYRTYMILIDPIEILYKWMYVALAAASFSESPNGPRCINGDDCSNMGKKIH